MSDIVQVIERVVEARERYVECGVDGCLKCSQRTTDIAQLRALRDLIEEDRAAWARRLNSNTSTAFMERMHDAERALLAFCRKVGT